MPAEIVNLSELVPGLDGKTFVLGDGANRKEYHVPGDLSTEHVLGFLKLFEDMLSFQEKAQALDGDATGLAEVAGALEALTVKIREKLLAVFRIANPDLEEFPFGQQTTMFVLGEVLAMMGLADTTGPLPVPPPKRAAKPVRKKTRKRSTRTAA